METIQMGDEGYALMGEVEMSTTPKSITQAYQSPEAPSWKEAIMDEMHSIKQNEVLSEPMDLPLGQTATATRMLFVRKYNSFGSVDRYKARLVYSYLWFKNKIDWGQLFAPVIDKVSIRIFWAMCASRQYHIEQVDVITAFLYGKCKQEVYITLPKELQSPEELQEGMVRKMQKSLYGTPDAPKIWYSTIAEYLRELGFEKSKREQCLFQNATTKVMIMIYVDDLAVAGPTKQHTEDVILKLKDRFQMREMGLPTLFLGINIHHYPRQRIIFVNQKS
jgi:hypothetical protein